MFAKSLIVMNGAYGKRIAEIFQYLGREHRCLDKGDYLPPRGVEVAAILDKDPDITHVLLVHCETSSGILNPLQEIADVVGEKGRELLIDAMSSFAALPIDCQTLPFLAIVASANKCLESVPGFGFILARKDALAKSTGNSHSLSLDLHAQWDYMNKTGQWRFTPPTHAVAACVHAMKLYEQAGGQAARLARYCNNRDHLVTGMQAMGFSCLLDGQWLSPIIVTFFAPSDENFTFSRFYEELKARDFIIYPGKLTTVDSFRIGCIGQIHSDTITKLLNAIDETLRIMHVASGAARAEDLAQRDHRSKGLRGIE
ncbi:MAG: 2-aminoethylphosphonate--pyruvate transaminase [Pseudomonadota bacterium]